MKTRLALVITVFFANVVYAQSDQEKLRMIHGLWGIGKKYVVASYMHFNKTEAFRFWPVYFSYSDNDEKLAEQRIFLLYAYENNYAKLSNKDAKRLSQNLLKNDLKQDKLRKRYYKKFAKAVSPARASQFLQLEILLQTIFRNRILYAMQIMREKDFHKEAPVMVPL
jgi:hypothetical protein